MPTLKTEPIPLLRGPYTTEQDDSDLCENEASLTSTFDKFEDMGRSLKQDADGNAHMSVGYQKCQSIS